MLNKPSISILGFIAQKPASAYELLAIFRGIGLLNDGIGESTIFNYTKKLFVSGYLEPLEDSGPHKRKTVYKITESGLSELKETIRYYTIHYCSDITWFNHAEIHLDIFPKDEVIMMLKQRIQAIEYLIKCLEVRYNNVSHDTTLPPFHASCLYRQIMIHKGELKGARNLCQCFADNEANYGKDNIFHQYRMQP